MDPTTLLTSWEEHTVKEEDGFTVTRISSGEPHTRAIFNAVLSNYHRITGRERPVLYDVQALIDEKATMVTSGENMIGGGLIVAREGTVRQGSTGVLAFLPKGARTKGYRIDTDKLFDLIPGWSMAKAQEYVDTTRAHMPTLRPLTQERLEQMPASSDTLGLCVFGTYRMPDSEQADALVLMGEYMRDDDIVDTGVVLLRPDVGVSEHGSVYGQTLLRGAFGEVVGYQPITFAEGIHLCNLDFDEAYAQVIGRTLGVEFCPVCGQPDNCGDCDHTLIPA